MTIIKMNQINNDPTECQMVAEVIWGGITRQNMKGSIEYIRLMVFHLRLQQGVIDSQVFG